MFIFGLVQLMAENLRGEMSANLEGAKLCLSDSLFIKVIAKSLSISCKEVSTRSTAPEQNCCFFSEL